MTRGGVGREARARAEKTGEIADPGDGRMRTRGAASPGPSFSGAATQLLGCVVGAPFVAGGAAASFEHAMGSLIVSGMWLVAVTMGFIAVGTSLVPAPARAAEGKPRCHRSVCPSRGESKPAGCPAWPGHVPTEARSHDHRARSAVSRVHPARGRISLPCERARGGAVGRARAGPRSPAPARRHVRDGPRDPVVDGPKLAGRIAAAPPHGMSAVLLAVAEAATLLGRDRRHPRPRRPRTHLRNRRQARSS